MNQKIFNNIIIYVLIIYLFIRLYFGYDPIIILNKLLITNKICNIDNFTDITTINGLPTLNFKAPSFKSTYDIEFVKFYKNININFSEKELIDLCYFLKTLISINTYSSFSTPSEAIVNNFNEDEIHKIKDIISNKLNSGEINFVDVVFETIPIYYFNFNGKEVEPFIFNVDCKFGKIRIYINIDIRNDIYQNKEYVIINEFKPLINKNKESINIPIKNYSANKFIDNNLVFNTM